MTFWNAVKEVVVLWFVWQMERTRYLLSYRCHMILLSDNDPEIDYYALMHLNDYIKRFSLNRVIVVFSENKYISQVKELKSKKIRYVKVSQKKVELLKRVARIYGKYIRCIALDCPTEKMSKHISELDIFTKEEILCEAEYQLFEYERAIPYERETEE